jgi:hypothetical protein
MTYSIRLMAALALHMRPQQTWGTFKTAVWRVEVLWIHTEQSRASFSAASQFLERDTSFQGDMVWNV